MVGSDVATTCTSRIAMNMPMHIMANPTQVAAVTGLSGPGLDCGLMKRHRLQRIGLAAQMRTERQDGRKLSQDR